MANHYINSLNNWPEYKANKHQSSVRLLQHFLIQYSSWTANITLLISFVMSDEDVNTNFSCFKSFQWPVKVSMALVRKTFITLHCTLYPCSSMSWVVSAGSDCCNHVGTPPIMVVKYCAAAASNLWALSNVISGGSSGEVSSYCQIHKSSLSWTDKIWLSSVSDFACHIQPEPVSVLDTFLHSNFHKYIWVGNFLLLVWNLP